jgi:hypothetical protein
MKKHILTGVFAIGLACFGGALPASAGWDDSYAFCCGFHGPRYYVVSGPGYFAYRGYGQRYRHRSAVYRGVRKLRSR